MKVCFLVATFPNISEKFILDQAVGLIDQGCEVDVVAVRPPDGDKRHAAFEAYRMGERTTYTDVPSSARARLIGGTARVLKNLAGGPARALRALSVKRYSTAASLGKLPYYLDALRGRRYDVVHGHFGPNGLVGGYLKDIGIARACVTTFYGSDINSYPRRHGPDVYARLFGTGDGFVAISEFIRDRMMEYGCPAERIAVVPIGFKVAEFPFFERTDSQAGEQGGLVISTVARLVEKKGHEWCLRALPRVRQEVPHIRYLIAGSGPREAELRRLVDQLGIGENVRFLGMLDDREVLEVYRQSDVFVLPSVTASDGDMEGQALVLQEAQATGLPVVSTLHNGIPEGVVHGRTGFLVPERSADALADSILILARDKGLRSRMAREARDFVEGKYEISGICRKLVGIYEQALNDSGAIE